MRVRQCLRDDEVRARLDLGREPLGRDAHLDREVEPRHDGADTRGEAASREDRRKDPVGQLAQLLRAGLGVVEGLGDEGLRPAVAIPEGALGQLQRDDGVHEPLLRSVVEVAHHPAAGVVGGREEKRPRCHEPVAAVAFAIAVSSSSANRAIRASVSSGGGSSLHQRAVITPHRRG
jgi:hypothetical protein